MPGVMRLLIALCVLSACTPEGNPSKPQQAVPLILNVPEIAGKSEAEVARILGEPKERSTTLDGGKSYPALYYQEGQTEVVYVEGKAEWISVRNLTNLPFSAEALPALGITGAGEPSSASRGVIRWENGAFPPLHGVYLFSAQNDQLDYAYIQVSRAP